MLRAFVLGVIATAIAMTNVVSSPPQPILWLMVSVDNHRHASADIVDQSTVCPADAGYEQAFPCHGVSFIGRALTCSPGDTLQVFFPANEHEKTLVHNLAAMARDEIDYAVTSEEDLDFHPVFLPEACADVVVRPGKMFLLYVDDRLHRGRSWLVVMTNHGNILYDAMIPQGEIATASR